jgi:hypothetical protein
VKPIGTTGEQFQLTAEEWAAAMPDVFDIRWINGERFQSYWTAADGAVLVVRRPVYQDAP